MHHWREHLMLACLALLAAGCRKEPATWEASKEQPWASGGSQTVFDAGAGAFSHAFPDMDGAAAFLHGIGDIQFEQTFVSAPAPVNPGLGPLFNSVSCVSCHIGDGRGKPPANAGENPISLLLRLSVPGEGPHGGPLDAPGFGGQLQHRAIFGTQPEANLSISWSEAAVELNGGEQVVLRTPAVNVSNPYTALPSDLRWSARVAPPVFGLGLLEAILDQDLQDQCDEHDADGDGISGRSNRVWDQVAGRMSMGRFGWKAEQPTLFQQCGAAYNEDMGITSPLFPQENSSGQSQSPGTNTIEVTDSILHAVAFYVRTLAVPARRSTDDPAVLRGEVLFSAAKCDHCHVPEQHTAVNVAFPPVSNQRIFPYTDLLLHDMGPGLSDERPSFQASGAEWRTPPLWGLGLTRVVNGHQNFLHDGRARSVLEAILWHGGEAEASREAVRTMTPEERSALLAFLNSL